MDGWKNKLATGIDGIHHCLVTSPSCCVWKRSLSPMSEKRLEGKVHFRPLEMASSNSDERFEMLTKFAGSKTKRQRMPPKDDEVEFEDGGKKIES